MKKKFFLTAAAAAGMAVCINITALAGTWRLDARGWWWENDDGSYPVSSWQWLDGNRDGTEECYYFNEEGYMLAGTTTPDGYTVNRNGAWVEDGAVQSRSAAESAAAKREITEEEIDAFFDDTVFVGDSVMEGFRNYAMARSDTWLGRPKFLAAVSLSAVNALRPVSSKSKHPVYEGKKRPVEDSIAMMGAKKVFIFFGLNDINSTGIKGTPAKYVELVERIRDQSPDVEIHIMSMTYTAKGYRDQNLYNDNIRIYNDTMKDLAAEQGWGFVDVANPLADANGDLKSSYCYADSVHLRNSAYEVWSAVLRDYAKGVLEQAALDQAATGGTLSK